MDNVTCRFDIDKFLVFDEKDDIAEILLRLDLLKDHLAGICHCYSGSLIKKIIKVSSTHHMHQLSIIFSSNLIITLQETLKRKGQHGRHFTIDTQKWIKINRGQPCAKSPQIIVITLPRRN